MRNYNAKDVESYIASCESEARPALKELRRVIKSTIPKAEEGISWGIPFYKYHGFLAGFVAFNNHVSFGFTNLLLPADRTILEEKGYVTGKKTVQIQFSQKIPATDIKQILKAKAKMNEAGKK